MTNKMCLGLDISKINLKKFKIHLIIIIFFELTCLLLKLKLRVYIIYQLSLTISVKAAFKKKGNLKTLKGCIQCLTTANTVKSC